MSLRWHLKILSAFILVILVVVLPSIFYVGSNLKNFLMNQKEQELRRELKLAGQMVAEKFKTGPGETARMQNLALQVGADLQKRVTIISRDGRVLGDSGLTPEAVDKMEDHSNRAEILAAREKGFGQSIRFSTTLQANTLYGAVPIYQNNKLAGYVRLALPLSQVEALVSALRQSISLTGVLTGILAVLLSLFLTWSINRPLRDITGMVKRMADGELKQPFHLLPKTEFSELTSSLERMANELREKMELLDIETSQLTTLLSTMREGVLITDEKGRIILMNPFLQELLGKRVIWKKRTVQEIFMNSELQDAVESVLHGEPYKGLQIVYGRNPQMHFDVQVAALFPDRGSHRAVALFHDTTKLQYLLKVRQDFVANASHELRTPLTSISGYVETLLSLAPSDPPEFQRFLSIIQKNVNQMNFLVSDLLDLAKLDIREKPEKNIKQVLVKEVLETSEQMIMEHIRKKGIDFYRELKNLPEGLTAFWDKDRIVQALFNILDNAVKYTPEGGQIRLSASTISDFRFRISESEKSSLTETTPQTEFRNPQSAINISVADTGIGIPRELQSRIFERFYRVDKARSRDLGGTGLGLAIVKHIVETHGGLVQVDSVVGQGSTFSLILPLTPNIP